MSSISIESFIRLLLAAIAFLVPGCACGQTASDAAAAAADNLAIHRLLDQYTQAVDTVDLKLLAQVWSHSPDVYFIYPLGAEHGSGVAHEPLLFFEEEARRRNRNTVSPRAVFTR